MQLIITHLIGDSLHHRLAICAVTLHSSAHTLLQRSHDCQSSIYLALESCIKKNGTLQNDVWRRLLLCPTSEIGLYSWVNYRIKALQLLPIAKNTTCKISTIQSLGVITILAKGFDKSLSQCLIFVHQTLCFSIRIIYSRTIFCQ